MAIKSVMEETIDYIPKYAGNRMQKDPLWVKIYPLTRAEADRYRDMITLEDQGGGFRQGRVKSNAEGLPLGENPPPYPCRGRPLSRHDCS